MAAKKQTKVSVDAFIAEQVAAMAAADKQGQTAVGSILLNLVSGCFDRIAAGEGKPGDIGASVMLAIKNAELAAKEEPPKTLETLDGFAKSAMVRLMRVADEHKDWYKTFLANVIAIHNERPIKITTLLELGRRVFGGKFNGVECKPVETCPDVETLKAWRKAANKGREQTKAAKEAKAKANKETTPLDRINAAAAVMAGCKAWLPVELQAHGETVIRELVTIAKGLATPKPAPKSDAELLAEYKAMLAKAA